MQSLRMVIRLVGRYYVWTLVPADGKPFDPFEYGRIVDHGKLRPQPKSLDKEREVFLVARRAFAQFPQVSRVTYLGRMPPNYRLDGRLEFARGVPGFKWYSDFSGFEREIAHLSSLKDPAGPARASRKGKSRTAGEKHPASLR